VVFTTPGGYAACFNLQSTTFGNTSTTWALGIVNSN